MDFVCIDSQGRALPAASIKSAAFVRVPSAETSSKGGGPFGFDPFTDEAQTKDSSSPSGASMLSELSITIRVEMCGGMLNLPVVFPAFAQLLMSRHLGDAPACGTSSDDSCSCYVIPGYIVFGYVTTVGSRVADTTASPDRRGGASTCHASPLAVGSRVIALAASPSPLDTSQAIRERFVPAGGGLSAFITTPAHFAVALDASVPRSAIECCVAGLAFLLMQFECFQTHCFTALERGYSHALFLTPTSLGSYLGVQMIKKVFGCAVTCVTHGPEEVRVLEGFGIDPTREIVQLGHTVTNATLGTALLKRTAGSGYDVVVLSGHTPKDNWMACGTAAAMVKPGGIVVVIGELPREVDGATITQLISTLAAKSCALKFTGASVLHPMLTSTQHGRFVHTLAQCLSLLLPHAPAATTTTAEQHPHHTGGAHLPSSLPLISVPICSAPHCPPNGIGLGARETVCISRELLLHGLPVVLIEHNL